MRIRSRIIGILAAVAAVLAAVVVGSAPAHAIVGGTVVDPAAYPYFVSIAGSAGDCGGSVIADSWVLTAAHCAQYNVNSPGSLLVARPQLSQSVPWPWWAAQSVIVHPLYDGVPGHGHDLALIRLPDGALAGVPRVHVGSPWDPGAYAPGVGSTILGYGLTGGSTTEDGKFRVAGTTLRSDAAMSGTFAWKDALMIGAGSSGQTTCFGDSGGPLVESRAGQVVQVGVTSFGTQSCDQAAAFAELSGPQLAWIAIHVTSIMDGWGACTAPSGATGVSEATYVAADTTGPQADGPYYWQIWCWAPTVTVPDLRGSTSTAATSALRARGLDHGVINYAVDINCDHIGQVTGQNPPAYTSVAVASTVSYTIGTRPKTACP